MLAAFKIFLLLAVLNASKSENSPEPDLVSKTEFLGFFGEDKYCYYKHSITFPRVYDCSIEKVEFVVKDFSGQEISRDIVKTENIKPDYDSKKLIIKTEYPSTRNIIAFLRNNRVTKNQSLRHLNLYLKENFLYYKRDNILKKDSALILDSSQVRKLITKYNKEPIHVEYTKDQWSQDIKLGDYEMNQIYDGYLGIYEWKNKYLLILNEHDYSKNNDAIIIVNKPLIDNILKKE